MTERQKSLADALPPEAQESPSEAHARDTGVIVATNHGGNARATWGKVTGVVVNESTGRYEPQVREDLRWLFSYAIDQGWSMAETAKRVDCDSSVLSKIYNGKYTDANNPGRHIVPVEVLKDIRRVRRAVELQAQAAKLGGFVETQTSDLIFRVCNAALKHSTVAFIWGPSHVGKTEALDEFRRRSQHGAVKMIRIEPGSGVFDLVRQIARVCGISDKGNIGDMKSRIKRCIDKSHVIIVDELHELTFTYQKRSKLSCMELLRWLHDLTGCGMVLCGTNILRDEIRNGKDKDLLDQLVRRALTTLDLKHSPTAKDIAAFESAYGLNAPDAVTADTVRALCRQKGVKALIYRLSRAKSYAESEGRSPTWDDFMAEHEMLASYETGEVGK